MFALHLRLLHFLLQLGLSKLDNTTPVRLVYNTANHLQGPSRCLGGVIVGISGVLFRALFSALSSGFFAVPFI